MKSWITLFKTLLLLAGILPQGPSAWAQYYDPPRSPIVMVGSKYSDRITEIGSGVLIDYGEGNLPQHKEYPFPQSQFVLTNAHLINGKDPWVRINWKRVHSKVIDFDAVGDYAILEIPKSGIPSAYTYSPEDGFFPNKQLGSVVRCTGDQIFPTDVPGKTKLYHPYDPEDLFCGNTPPDERLKRIHFSAANGRSPFEYSLDLVAHSRGIVLSPSWASPGSEEGSLPKGFRPWRQDPDPEVSADLDWLRTHEEEFYSKSRPFNTFDGKHFVIPALTSGGNSGSLVVDEENMFRFLGIPAQYHYFSKQVKVVGPELFAHMFDRNRDKLGKPLELGSSAKKNYPRWKVSENGYPYLDFGDGTIDADFTRTTSGMAVDEPSGGQGSSAPPGGQGSSAPPGENCHDQNEDHLPESPTLQDTKASVLAASKILLGKKDGIDPSEVFTLYGISPFMSKDGKRIYGFEVTDPNGPFRAILAPNAEAYDWALKQASLGHYKIQPLFSPPTATELLETKMKNQVGAATREPVLGRAFISKREISAEVPEAQQVKTVMSVMPVRTGQWERGISHWTYSPAPQILKSKTIAQEAALHHGTASIQLREDGIHLNWKFFRPRQLTEAKDPKTCAMSPWQFEKIDELEVVLDKNGLQKGQKEFMPIIKVRSQKGSEFYLDLRPLLYTDLSLTYPATERVDWASQKDGLPLFASQIGLRLTTIRDATRSGAAWDERTIQFNTKDRPRNDGQIDCSVTDSAP